MRIVKDLLLWVYWHPFRRFIRSVGPSLAYRLARPAATLLALGARGKRAAFKRELDFITGGDTDPAGSRRIIRETFRVWLCNEFEMLLFPAMNAENISRFVSCSGVENLDKGLAAGKGVLLLFAHFGANQMVMPAIGYRGIKMSQLSAPPTVWEEKLPNRKFTPMETKGLELRWAHEQSLPVTHINIFGSLRRAFQCLKRNEVLGLAMDGGGGASRVTVELLGRRAAFSNGPVQIAMRTGCAVLPTFMVREPDGRSTLVIEAPLQVVIRWQQRVPADLEDGDDGEHILTVPEDQVVVDLTEQVRQCLTVEMPVAVHKAGTSGEIHTDPGAGDESSNEPVDPRWSALKSIKF